MHEPNLPSACDSGSERKVTEIVASCLQKVGYITEEVTVLNPVGMDWLFCRGLWQQPVDLGVGTGGRIADSAYHHPKLQDKSSHLCTKERV